MRRLLLAAAIGLLLNAGAARANSLEEGKAAYGRGDYADAIKWFGYAAAAQGNAEAQVSLGRMYDTGTGVARNYAEAVRLYRLAAAQGNAEGQYRLGSMYGFGAGVPKDDAEAVKWYQLAAAQGHAGGQLSLGTAYDLGKGVAQNYAEAGKWFRLAAAQGDKYAMASLGSYEIGRDNVRAYMWLTLGEGLGDRNRDYSLDMAARKMTSQQIADAQRMARECQQRNFKDCDSIQTGSDTAANAPPRANELSWSGSNTSNTRPFSVDGPWELHWSATGSFFSIFIRSESGDVVGVGANQAGSGDGSSFQPKGGRYFLAVSAIGQWRIWITPP
jgi:hypothetical protein